MEPKYFGGREKKLETFINQFEKAGRGIFNHFLILGNWGIGKTTLLKEYKKIAQENKVLTSFVPIRKFSRTNEFLSATEHLVTQIPINLPTRFKKLKEFQKYLDGLGISLPVIGGGVQFARKNKYQGDPQVLLMESLIRLWSELKKDNDAVIVLLDDVQNYQNLDGFLTILKNALSYDEIVENTGYLFVLSCTYDGWSQFMKKNHPIGRYFIPIVRLKELDRFKSIEVIENTLKGTNVTFEKDVMEKVYEYTEGHPFQMQLLCEYLYENQISGKVTEEVWENALEATLMDLGEIIMDYLFDLASEKEKGILIFMAREYRVWNLSDLFEKVEISDKGILGKLLERLTRKDIIVKVGRGNYRLPNRMFSEYLLRK